VTGAEGRSARAEATAPRLFGILVTFNRPTELSLMLSRLAEQDQPLEWLVIVDNARTPDSEAAVRRFAAEHGGTTYVAAPENLGSAGGIAEGMERILALERLDDGDWIVLLDDDDPPDDPTLLAELREFGGRMAQVDPRTAAVGKTGAVFDWRRGRLLRPRDDELDGPVPVDCIGGGQLPLYRIGPVREVGPFSRRLFFGLDDLDYGLRLRDAGYSLYVSGPRWRDERAKRGRLGLEVRPALRTGEAGWRRYYSLRNLLHILRAHGRVGAAVEATVTRGFLKPLLNVFVSPRRGWQHLRLNLRACRDAWTGRMGRTIEPEGYPVTRAESSD
jgi:glycosyltransferase involved in cell wall biosynthesis